MFSANIKPNGELGIIALQSCKELGEKIDNYLCEKWRKNKELDPGLEIPESVLISINEVRFANGEGKVIIEESVRGKDIYILCDIGNYGCTYNMFGFEHHMSPDEHYQDIKRVVSALNGRAKRVTVVMPLMYEGRQHRRKHRESLDCALSLQELERLGVSNIITFDVHDPNVQNAIPIVAFQNLYPTFEIVRKFIELEKKESVDNSKLIVISPDTGAMDRSIYYASVLGVDVGLFYKRRDYSQVVNGKNPIIQHEYMGRDVEGQNILITDDMIASGESIFDIASELKKRKANKIYVAATFALFTEGIAKFDEYYDKCIIDKVLSTNLAYLPKEVLTREWFLEVDVSEFLADIIDNINADKSIAPLINDVTKIKELRK